MIVQPSPFRKEGYLMEYPREVDVERMSRSDGDGEGGGTK